MGLPAKKRRLAVIGIGVASLLLSHSVYSAQQSAPDGDLKPPTPPRFSTSGNAVPIHRFWTAENWYPLNLTAEGGPYTMFPEPLAVQTTATGYWWDIRPA